jgi:3-phenylpropionate/trans-cinnamate dioxygenase ferredoxin reductase subunit
MSNADPIVIVGGGQAAGQLADSLRREGFAGAVTLLCDEPMLPYQRPHLSKLYLAGILDREKLLYRPRDFYAPRAITVMSGRRATAIDAAARQLRLDDGSTLAYSGLALCTGAVARRLPVPGADAAGVHCLRTLADCERLRAALTSATRVVCVGGGLISLEAAGVMAGLGKQVTVLASQQRVMESIAVPAVSAFFREVHESRGIVIRTGCTVTGIETANGTACAVLTANGERIPADLVLVGIGVEPEVELAREAGLSCDSGIVVDELARTSDSHIVAAGDCTRHPNAILGRSLRLESVHNAVEQAKTAAATLCGKRRPYAQAPWFWSDQQGYLLQVVGIAGRDAHTVLRGDTAAGSFAAWCFEGERLVACQSVNRPREYMACRRMLENDLLPSPVEVAHPRFDPEARLPRKAPLAFQRRAV